MYCYKILTNLTQNCGLKWTYNEKKGYIFNVPKYSKYCHLLREQSFAMIGPKLFNSLPIYLRQKFEKFEHWKIELDNFLSQIPDNPVTSRIDSGLCNLYTSKSTNSLCRWIPFLSTAGKLRKLPTSPPLNT